MKKRFVKSGIQKNSRSKTESKFGQTKNRKNSNAQLQYSKKDEEAIQMGKKYGRKRSIISFGLVRYVKLLQLVVKFQTLLPFQSND